MMARRTAWLVTFDKPGSGEIPDGGDTRLAAYTSAMAAKRGAEQYAEQLYGVSRKRYPWTKVFAGKWVATWEDDEDEYVLEAVEVELLTAREVH